MTTTLPPRGASHRPGSPGAERRPARGRAAHALGKARLAVQEDANGVQDEPVEPRQMRGKVLYSIPKLGFVKEWVGGHLLLLAGGLALGISSLQGEAVKISRLRWRSVRRVVVVAMVAGVVVGAPVAAFADGGDRLLELSERGGDSIVEVFFDDVVPGDSGEFTVDIRNAGPTPGVLVVELPRPGLSGDVSRRFYSELVVEGPHLGRTRVADLVEPFTPLLVQRLVPGQQVSVPLRFEFPFEGVGGNEALEGEHVVDIDLRARIVGEDEVSPSPSPGGSGGGGGSAVGSRGPLPRTGGDLRLLALAGVVTGVGLTVWVLATRRKEREGAQ